MLLAQREITKSHETRGAVQDVVKLSKDKWNAEGRPGEVKPAAGRRRLMSSWDDAEAAAEEELAEAVAGADAAAVGSSLVGGRRRLLAYAKSHPLQRKCDEEKLIKTPALAGEKRALQQCLNSIEGCKEPAKARSAANALRGVKALAKKVPCLVVSDACGPKPPPLSSQPETGMHLSGRIPPAKRDLPRWGCTS